MLPASTILSSCNFLSCLGNLSPDFSFSLLDASASQWLVCFTANPFSSAGVLSVIGSGLVLYASILIASFLSVLFIPSMTPALLIILQIKNGTVGYFCWRKGESLSIVLYSATRFLVSIELVFCLLRSVYCGVSYCPHLFLATPPCLLSAQNDGNYLKETEKDQVGCSVMISYSRKDKSFVKNLYDALAVDDRYISPPLFAVLPVIATGAEVIVSS